jgi:hypothetical protein
VLYNLALGLCDSCVVGRLCMLPASSRVIRVCSRLHSLALSVSRGSTVSARSEVAKLHTHTHSGTLSSRSADSAAMPGSVLLIAAIVKVLQCVIMSCLATLNHLTRILSDVLQRFDDSGIGIGEDHDSDSDHNGLPTPSELFGPSSESESESQHPDQHVDQPPCPVPGFPGVPCEHPRTTRRGSNRFYNRYSCVDCGFVLYRCPVDRSNRD